MCFGPPGGTIGAGLKGATILAQWSVKTETAAIAAGATEALARFYHLWFDELYAESRRVTGRDESFCLDVVQDVMLRVVRSMRAFDHEESLRRWLRVVVRTSAIDRLRADSRRQRRELARNDRSDAHDPVVSRATLTETRERLEWLRQELANMDEPSARMVMLRYRFGWTLAQIGEAFGLKTGAVDGRLKRIIRSLKGKAAEECDA